MDDLEDKKNNRGCFRAIALVVGVLTFWGLLGMLDGHGFGESVEATIKSLGFLIVICLVFWGIISLQK